MFEQTLAKACFHEKFFTVRAKQEVFNVCRLPAMSTERPLATNTMPPASRETPMGRDGRQDEKRARFQVTKVVSVDFAKDGRQLFQDIMKLYFA